MIILATYTLLARERGAAWYAYGIAPVHSGMHAASMEYGRRGRGGVCRRLLVVNLLRCAGRRRRAALLAASMEYVVAAAVLAGVAGPV